MTARDAQPAGHTGAGRAPGAALVDAHVHWHDCFDEPAFFGHAERNIGRAATRLGLDRPTGLLMLTESAGVDRFGRLARNRGVGRDVTRTDEAESLLVAGGGAHLVLVAGRQIITSDGLEVLALGTRERFRDGRALRETLGGVRRAGALAVLPWGFGKWWWRRGALVEQVVRAGDVDGLGDNGGRTRVLGEPAAFRIACQLGIPILPGSDPLPFRREVRRVGGYGFRLQAPVSLGTPARDLAGAIRGGEGRIVPFGSLRAFGPFLWTQARMQLKRRTGVG